MQDSADPYVVVTFYSPHRISAHSQGEETILGCSVDLLRGRSIQIFQGPKSDWLQLSAAIKNAELKTPVTIEMDLYDIHGKCERKLVGCTPVCNAGGKPLGCRVSISSIPSG